MVLLLLCSVHYGKKYGTFELRHKWGVWWLIVVHTPLLYLKPIFFIRRFFSWTWKYILINMKVIIALPILSLKKRSVKRGLGCYIPRSMYVPRGGISRILNWIFVDFYRIRRSDCVGPIGSYVPKGGAPNIFH